MRAPLLWCSESSESEVGSVAPSYGPLGLLFRFNDGYDEEYSNEGVSVAFVVSLDGEVLYGSWLCCTDSSRLESLCTNAWILSSLPFQSAGESPHTVEGYLTCGFWDEAFACACSEDIAFWQSHNSYMDLSDHILPTLIRVTITILDERLLRKHPPSAYGTSHTTISSTKFLSFDNPDGITHCGNATMCMPIFFRHIYQMIALGFRRI